MTHEHDVWDVNNNKQLIAETINVTTLKKNQMQLSKRRAHIVGFQEHAVDGKAAAAAIEEAKANGWNMSLGPVDPELNRKTGGVGFQSTEEISLLPIRCKTEDYKDAEATGRLKIMEIELEDGGRLQISNIYGWTGAIKG